MSITALALIGGGINGTQQIDLLPNSVENGIASWSAAVGNVYAGNDTCTISFKRPTAARATTRVTCKLNRPTEYLDANTGLYHVDDVTRFTAEFVLPDSVNSDDRRDMLAYAIAFLSSSEVTVAVEDYTSITG